MDKLQFGHVFLFIKGWYKVKMPRREALAIIIGDALLLEPQYVNVEKLVVQMALNYIIKNDYTRIQNLIELVYAGDPNSYSYKLRRCENFNDAILKNAISHLSIIEVDKLEGPLPDPTPLKFFTEDQLLETEDEIMHKLNKLKNEICI
jgi:hypothetical protein